MLAVRGPGHARVIGPVVGQPRRLTAVHILDPNVEPLRIADAHRKPSSIGRNGRVDHLAGPVPEDLFFPAVSIDPDEPVIHSARRGVHHHAGSRYRKLRRAGGANLNAVGEQHRIPRDGHGRGVERSREHGSVAQHEHDVARVDVTRKHALEDLGDLASGKIHHRNHVTVEIGDITWNDRYQGPVTVGKHVHPAMAQVAPDRIQHRQLLSLTTVGGDTNQTPKATAIEHSVRPPGDAAASDRHLAQARVEHGHLCATHERLHLEFI